MITITPETAALGAVVDGIDITADAGPEVIAELRAALTRHEVLFFPRQPVSPEAQVRFGQQFGALQVHVTLDALPDHPEVVVFDTARKATTAEWWHADVTCAPAPPMAAMLQLAVVPSSGGATHWASMTAAYDALDDATKERIDGLQARHVSWWQPLQESVHPVVRVHPETGRKALFVDGIFTKEILGLEGQEGAALLGQLCEHATRDEFTVRHDWQAGDIAFWDNRCTQHRVDNDFGGARRCGHRIALEGDVPR
ncbi:MAG: TauD/TfdA family dioxygenase [Acidimicrobiia bacterium]